MFTFGTTVIGDKAYTAQDAKQIMPATKYGIEDSFYGGRIKYIGLMDTDIVLLMTDPNTVIDTAADALDEVPIDLIRGLCKKRKLVKDGDKSPKARLIKMLGGEAVEKEVKNANGDDDAGDAT